MTPEGQPFLDNATAPPALDVAIIGKVVRDELDRQNKYLEFAQGQIEKDRSFYKHLYTYAGAFLAFMVAVAGYFSYTSVGQMRTDIKDSVQAELAAVRAQATATNTEAQATVKEELANVRTEVQKRIDTEFQSDNIAALVASAAKERTEKELSGIIRSETATQVAKGILEQGPAIKKTVEDQTKEAVKTLEPSIRASVDTAVKALQPTIKASVDTATQDQVRSSVAPIAQLADYADANGSAFMKSNDNIEQANRRAGELQAHAPRAVSALYDLKTGRIVIHLSSKLIVSFAPEDVQGLENATPSQLSEIEISPSGFGLHFPATDADLYVPGLLEGFLGSKSWMASRLGQIGGQATSKAKKAASRANGKLGGRPRKVLQPQSEGG